MLPLQHVGDETQRDQASPRRPTPVAWRALGVRRLSAGLLLACMLGLGAGAAARAELRLRHALDADPYVTWTVGDGSTELLVRIPSPSATGGLLPGFAPLNLLSRQGTDERLSDDAQPIVRYVRVPLGGPTAAVRLSVDSLLFSDGTAVHRSAANSLEVGDSLVPWLSDHLAPAHPLLLEGTGFDGSERLAYLRLSPRLAGLDGCPDRVLVEARARLIHAPRTLGARRTQGGGLQGELGSLPEADASPAIRARVSVTELGVQEILASDLRRVAPELLLVPGKQLGVVRDGEEQACRRVLDADGGLLSLEFIAGPRLGESELDVFQAGDFTDTETYFLQRFPEGALSMEQRDAAPSGTRAPVESFRLTRVLEEDSFFYNAVPEVGLDHWSWGPSLKSDDASPASRSVSLDELFPLDTSSDLPVVFRVTWHGRGLGTLDRPHRTEVSLGTELLSSQDWEGFKRLVQVAEASASAVVASGALRLTVPGIPGTGEDGASLDSISVSFHVPPLAREDLFDVHAPPGWRCLHLDGFSGSELRAFDLSRSDRPVELIGLLIESTPQGHSLALDFDGGVLGRPFLALGPSAVHHPLLHRSAPAELLEPASSVDWIAILPSRLAGSTRLDDLVAQRRSEGLRTRVIPLQDLFDIFSGGRRDPRALGAFLTHASGAWPRPLPRYILLLGDGSKDYKGASDPGASVLPAMLYDDPSEMLVVGHHAGDSRAAAVLGPDLLPEYMVGRIPARSAEELDLVIDKILKRQNSAAGSWRKKLLVARGDCESGDCFGSLAAELVDAVPRTHRVLALGATELRAGLLPPSIAAHGGTNLVLYLGHGGIDRWAPEDGYFSPYLGGQADSDPQVGDIATGGLAPIFVDGGSVLTGAYQHQALPGLQEQLLLSANSGSVGGLSASASSDSEHGREIGRATLEALFGLDKPKTLGEFAGQVRRALDSLGGPRTPQAVSGLTLLGDPAMPLGFPLPPGPALLRAAGTRDRIRLYWAAPTEAPAGISYRVYRSDEAAGPYELLAAGLSRTDHEDRVVLPERVYHYRVSLVDADGFESSGSKRVAASLGGDEGPVVHGCVPNRGAASGGERVVIAGENFEPGALGTLDGLPCLSSTWLDSEHLECISPSNVPGLVDAAVVNPDLRGDTAHHAYVYCLGLGGDEGGRHPLGGGTGALGGPVSLTRDALGRWQAVGRLRRADPEPPASRRGLALKPIIDPGITRWPIPTCP